LRRRILGRAARICIVAIRGRVMGPRAHARCYGAVAGCSASGIFFTEGKNIP
jgi:hypothetical protein